MRKNLEDYIDVIRQLPLKDKYSKEDILIPEFVVDKEGEIEIYYAPHNEYINRDASVFIVGITPGFSQMSTALVTARELLEQDESLEKIKYACKVAGRFSGSMRKNLIEMLDDIELNEVLGIKSCSALFEDRDDLLHTVSLIPYPVFVKKQNYTGHTPKLLKNEFLMSFVYDGFLSELSALKHKDELLIVPLGKAVDEVLDVFIKQGIIKENQVLKGFPHPSGANVNRLKQLEAFKASYKGFYK